MEVGQVIRLRTAFRPVGGATYRHGKVVALVPASRGDGGDPQGEGAEVLVELYDPLTRQVYCDATGTVPLYSFYLSEIE